MEATLYETGVLVYGELGEKEVVAKTFFSKDKLIQCCRNDVKDITNELHFTEEETFYIQQIQYNLHAKDEKEFLQYYYFSN